MEIREDDWLSGIFGHPVFKVTVEPAPAGGEDEPVGVGERISRHAAGGGPAMYYAKVDTTRVELVRQLSLAGLYVVDVNVTFGIDTRRLAAPLAWGGATVGEALPEHHRAVLDLASSCFQYSRFHLDPAIPAAVANRVKHDWVLSYLRKARGERLLAAVIGGRPVGFLAVLGSRVDHQRVKTIDLIGVDRAHQHRGIGGALVSFFVDEYAPQCDVLQVGTQAANVPSMRLYEKASFSVVKTSYVMHMHVGSHGTRR